MRQFIVEEVEQYLGMFLTVDEVTVAVGAYIVLLRLRKKGKKNNVETYLEKNHQYGENLLRELNFDDASGF